MKRYILLSITFLLTLPLFAQTVLQQGDIVIVTLNTDGDDLFEFFPLVDLKKGTIIHFTDKGWLGTKFRAGEGKISYTVPEEGITAGTLITMPGTEQLPSNNFKETNNFNLVNSRDNILVYQGDDTSPNFIMGVGIGTSPAWVSSEAELNANNSLIPSSLSETFNTIVTLSTRDNYQYDTKQPTLGTKKALLSLVTSSKNFSGNTSTPYLSFGQNFTIISETPNNDSDSEITAADTPIPTQTVITASAAEKTKEVFKFKITDKGTADGKPTKLTRVILRKGEENTLNWTNEISEAILHSGTVYSSATITKDALTFSISQGSIDIADGTSNNFTLQIKVSPNLTDGTKFQTQVATEHSFTAHSTGSTFETSLSAPIVSGVTTFDTKATELRFQTQPSSIQINKKIVPAIEVKAVDKNNNTDKDYSAAISLEATNISGTTTTNATSGIATFDSVQFTSVATGVKIIARSGTLSSEESTTFDVADITDNVNANSSITIATMPTATSIMPNETADLFAFTLQDKGGDTYPTKVFQIVITPASSNRLNWSETLQAAELKAEGATLSATVSISDTKITLNFKENSLTVSEGASLTCVLRGRLATTPIQENKTLALQIAATGHQASTSTTGSSAFSDNFETAVVSENIQTEIEATKICITAQPTEEIIGTAFTTPISAKLTDTYGNIDTNSTLSATISIANGTGDLSPSTSLSQIPTNGKCIWENLCYNHAETATFKLTTEKFTTTTASITFKAAQSSLIEPYSNPISNDTILSSRNTISQAKDFFKFTIKDQGEDGVPTQIKTIRFEKGKAYSQSRLYYLIGGVLLKKDGLLIGKVEKLSSSNGSSDVKIPLIPPLEIADGEQVEITTSLFMSAHKKLKEGEKIQLSIDKKHEWETTAEGSGLESPLSAVISSPIFSVDATATRLSFENVPKSVTPDVSFCVTVAAIDAQGIVDASYSGTITLSREAGTGILSSEKGLTMTFTNGKTSWTDLQYDSGESFTLLANATEFTPTESAPINANDTDSELKTALAAIPNGDIASTIASAATAQPVFAFILQDKGTHDGSPTTVTQTVFKNAHPTNGANWKDNIAGAVLLLNGNPIASTNKITDEEIIFSSSSGVVTIADGSSATVTLALFLKYNNLEDNSVFQCKIASKGTGFKTDGTGSDLQKLGKDMLSNLTTIRVTATQIDFLENPYALNTATETFSVAVAARDANGNIDTDYSETVTLKATHDIASSNCSNGLISFTNLQQNGHTDFTLTATSNGLNDATQTIIISSVSTDLDTNFEDGNLQYWKTPADWKASVVTPISGKYSLKHNLTNTVGTSNIAHSMGSFKLQDATTVWRWQMKNGDWNPSSSNNFYFVLASANQELSTGSGYAVGVNRSGSDDLLTLFKIEQGNTTPLISSEMLWKENGKAGIQVKLDSKGNWELAYDNNGSFDNLYKTGTAIDKPDMSGELFSGFVFNYGMSSRAGLFWADDIHIYHFHTAPRVKKLNVISATQLAITFHQDMDKNSTETINHYLINKNIHIQSIEQVAADSVLLTTSALRTDSYELSLTNIKSAAGIFLADTILSFDYFATAKQGEVILNELMVDEAPTVQLPENEYIELFNKTEKPFVLTDWSITVGKAQKTLPFDTIQPGAYVLLCSSSAQEALTAYGKAVAVSGFLTLTNTSGTVVLKNAEGLEIDKVVYEKSWYNDKNKENGGWSLERINPESPTNNRANWSASQNKRGGTPGAKNSIFGIILDATPPSIGNTVPISANQVKITFNEPIDSLAIKKTQLFFINGLGYAQKVDVSQDATQIILTFKKNFKYGKTYDLEIKEVVDWFGNTLENTTANFGLPELALPNEVIINEILFNHVSNNVDYVELYNRSEKIIDLATLFIATRDAKNTLKSVYVMSKVSRLLNPGAFVVLTTNTSLVSEQYEVKNPTALQELKSLPNFPDTEGTVIILNQENTVLDEFHYNEKMHSKLLVSKDGVSLERINYNMPTQSANNWHSAAQAAGFGTPTYQNSSYSALQTFDAEIHIDPRVFSPNGDGIDDSMQIHYQFDNPGHIANVSIFDSNGRLVRDIARNLMLDNKGIISWDGINGDNQRARTGRYIIFIELFDVNGKVSTYKKTCVLHGHFK